MMIGFSHSTSAVLSRDGGSRTIAIVHVDHKDLFKKVEKAIAVYMSRLAHDENAPPPEIPLMDRLAVGRARLDIALEALALSLFGLKSV